MFSLVPEEKFTITFGFVGLPPTASKLQLFIFLSGFTVVYFCNDLFLYTDDTTPAYKEKHILFFLFNLSILVVILF